MHSVNVVIIIIVSHCYTHDNHRLLSYHNNVFCNTIITLSILLHITTTITGIFDSFPFVVCLIMAATVDFSVREN